MSKRQLRSDTAAGAAAPPPLTNLSQPPAAKRQRKNEPIRFLCYACDEEKTAGRFPDYNPSSECEHLINTCKVISHAVQNQARILIYNRTA